MTKASDWRDVKAKADAVDNHVGTPMNAPLAEPACERKWLASVSGSRPR